MPRTSLKQAKQEKPTLKTKAQSLETSPLPPPLPPPPQSAVNNNQWQFPPADANLSEIPNVPNKVPSKNPSKVQSGDLAKKLSNLSHSVETEKEPLTHNLKSEPKDGSGEVKSEAQAIPPLKKQSKSRSKHRWSSKGVLPPEKVKRPSLVGADPPPTDSMEGHKGSISLKSNPPTEPPARVVFHAKEPSLLSSDDRRSHGSLNMGGSMEEMIVPPPLRGISGQSGVGNRKYDLQRNRLSEPIPPLAEVLEKKRRQSSSDRKNSFYGNQIPKKEDVFEYTIYNKKSSENDPNFQKQKSHLITPNTLYKEALYTSVHYLGLPTVRFPSTKEDLCLYSHVVFKAEPHNQIEAMEHVTGEAFPLVVVNTNVRRADSVEARDHTNLPFSYCVVAIETDKSLVDFQIDMKEWGRISTGTPLRPVQVKSSSHHRPVPEKRFDQMYSNVPPSIKTNVQPRTRCPIWDQRFQCLALRPSVDILTIEIWDDESEHSEKKSKNKHDLFLGKVSIPIKEIPCEGEAKWRYIKGVTHRKKEATGRLLMEVWLTHAYRHGKNYEEYAEPRIVLEMLWDHVLQYESSRYPGEWNGDIPPAATCLLFQYALQTGISEASQAIVRWNAYAKYNLGLFAMETRLLELESSLEKARDWKDVRECELETNMIILAIERILPVIRNHLNETQETVHEAVKAIKHCREILTKFQCKSAVLKVQFWVEAEIRMAILEWYQAKFAELIAHQQWPRSYELIECLARVVNEVNKLMRECDVKWKPLFWLDGLVQYMPLAYDEFQKMIIHDVETVCYYTLKNYDTNAKLRKVLVSWDSDARNLCRALFDLYVETQVFVGDQTNIFETVQDRYYHLNRYHRWFRPILVLWLGYALIRAADMISYSIKIDNVAVENESAMTSSSATDAGVVYHQLTTFWQQLNWPDVAEGYVILHYIFEVMCFITILYARLKRGKLESEGYFDTVDRFDISERFCTCLNNIEYVKECLIKIPDDIEMDQILQHLDQAVGESFARSHRLRVNKLLTGTLAHIEIQFKKIMFGVAERVRPELREALRECFLFLEDKTRTEEDALIPVLTYLEDNIVILHKSLLELNFVRVLQMFWNVTCQEILYALKIFTKKKDIRNEKIFFDRLEGLLALLVSYFGGGGGGLNEMEIDTKYYRQLKLFLSCLSLPTDTLIAAYYREAAEEQLELKNSSLLGTLTARVSYHSGILTVDVVSASNLSARDDPPRFLTCCKKQEASSDPQVEIRLMPSHYFPNIKSYKTEIIWKSQNPVFNQTFTWNIAEDTCRKPESVVVFTLRDYDRITHDDFLGQAVVPLGQMPGLLKLRPVAQPMTLQLRPVDIKHNPVLTILGNRKWDSNATSFVQDQEKRVITIKDEPPLKLSK